MSADPNARPDGGTEDEAHPTDEEQTETEWHIWVVALLIVGGGALVIFPPQNWPWVGFVLVGIGALAWVLKTLIERAE